MEKDNRDIQKQEEKIKPRRKRKAFNFKRFALIVSIVIFIGTQLISAWQDTNPTSTNIELADVQRMNELDLIEKVEVTKTSNTFLVYDNNGFIYSCVNPRSDNFIYDLMKEGIPVTVRQASLYDAIMDMIVTMPMFIVMLMFIYYLTSTIVGGSTKMFTLLKKDSNPVTFNDVAGISEIKEEVMNIVSVIRNYKKLAENGARPVKGLLFYGPPGVGKTLIAKAIATEVNMPFISASASDFNEMFVGVGAARVRSLWDLALQNAPCILFIDEIDSLGKRRGGSGGAEGEKNQTLNALLQRMDGLNPGNGVFVIAATNRKDDLDPALIRPGRFDRHLYIGKPRLKKDKEEVIDLYLKTKRLHDDVTLEKVSHLISDMSGAEIEDALNNAVYNSIKRGDDGMINLSDIDLGVMQLYTDGVPVPISSEHDKRITAVHEAGHTIANLLLNRQVIKVSVVPFSSGVGGLTVTTNEETENDKLRLESDFLGDIKVLLAGKVAEDLILGQHTQGAQNDIERATSLIYNMTTSYGFNNNLFNINVLLREGALPGVSAELINKCNDELIKIEAETANMIKENIAYVRELSDMLMKSNTVLYPTLDTILAKEDKVK